MLAARKVKEFVTTKYFCCNKTFLVTNVCCHTRMFVAAKVLSQPAYFCHGKKTFCCDKSKLVATKLFVVTKICLLWQNVCREKHAFIATKDMLLINQYVFPG